ncbi:MAG: hypothetical protein AB7V58_05930 [Solirubrobacterales bacterium]
MDVEFKTECQAELTEVWHIAAPPGWHAMTPEDQRSWLAEHIDSATLDTEEVHDEEDRIVTDLLGP